MQFKFFKANFTNNFTNNLFSCLFAYQNLESQQSCHKYSFPKTLNLRSFRSRSAFFLTGFIICFFPPTTLQKCKSPIYLPNESILAQNFPIFQFLSPHFLTHEKFPSKLITFLICDELVIQCKNHKIFTIIPRARLHVLHTFTSNSFARNEI